MEGRTPWELPIYQGVTNPNKIVKPSLIYQMADLPENCYRLKIENGTIIEEYGNGFLTAFRVEHYSDPSLSYGKSDFKFILPKKPEGKLQIMGFYNRERKWVVESLFENYCVDGFYTKAKDGLRYTRNQEQFVVFICEVGY